MPIELENLEARVLDFAEMIPLHEAAHLLERTDNSDEAP
jgi:hypothetical protein